MSNKSKKVGEIFSDYKTNSNIKYAEVTVLNVVKKTNTLQVGLYFDEYIENLHVCGVGGAKNCKGQLEYIAKQEPDYENDILIFATDMLVVKSKFKKVIAIQHGIAFDITKLKKTGMIKNIKYALKGALRALVKHKRFSYCSDIVCVDYNFVNWYRTQVAHIDARLHVIPNFSKIPGKTEREENRISIIFARRLVEYRGTRIFTNAIKKIKRMHPDVSVTIAGEGPEKKWMQEQLQEFSGVTFTSYKPDESLSIHQKHDIAVVPTRGSEGTSLSLLEAMATGCAVIATNVGGMTNIILDGFNGLMISPDSDELADALLKLIENEELRKKLSCNARETVTEAFSYEKWRERWIKLIQGLENETVK